MIVMLSLMQIYETLGSGGGGPRREWPAGSIREHLHPHSPSLAFHLSPCQPLLTDTNYPSNLQSNTYVATYMFTNFKHVLQNLKQLGEKLYYKDYFNTGDGSDWFIGPGMTPSYVYPLNFKHSKTNYITATYCHNIYILK